MVESGVVRTKFAPTSADPFTTFQSPIGVAPPIQNSSKKFILRNQLKIIMWGSKGLQRNTKNFSDSFNLH
ncbi:hypothetical protein MMC10_005859 [Thelotrema lepadinum]|nr:hypothetical protein [Thelotrema lepadinum]